MSSKPNQTEIWYSLIDAVSEMIRVSWLQVYKLGVFEFLNYATLAIIRNKRLANEQKKLKMKYGK